MAKRRVRRPYIWLRRFLLLILLLVIGALGLYLFGRSGRPELGPSSPTVEAPVLSAREDVTTVGEGFEYTHYQEGRAAFAIRAQRTLEDREETVFLEGVGLTLFEASGREYDLVARHATYNREHQSAVLEGEVRLSDASGLELFADGLELGRGGRLLSSVGPVRIRYGAIYQGRGDRLRIHLPEDLFLVAGDVLLETVPGQAEPMELRSERLSFERSRKLLRADGGVEIHLGGDEIRSRSLNVFFEDDLSRIRFLRARWEVTGRRVVSPPLGEAETGPPPSAVFELSGRSLSMLAHGEGEGFESMELEGSPTDPASLRSQDGGGMVRILTAGYLSSHLIGDGRQIVEAFGRPEIVESAPAAGGPNAPRRRLWGGRAQAELSADGSFNSARFFNGVEYRDGDIEVEAEWAGFRIAEGTAEFFGTAAAGGDDPMARALTDGGDVAAATLEALGEPRQRLAKVRVRSPRGEVIAPWVAYQQELGTLHAHGGVSTLLTQGLEVMPAAPDGEATRVESLEAIFRESPEGADFRGDVRAWQGENVLLAGWLKGDSEQRLLTAGEGVRSVVMPGGEPAERVPMTVTATRLTYRESEGEIVYEEQVRAEQEGRKLTCNRLQVHLDEGRQADRWVCAGKVHLEDPESGNVVDAERAVYAATTARVEFYGDPAVVRDRQGATVEAPWLTYDLEEGRVRASMSPEVAGRGDGRR